MYISFLEFSFYYIQFKNITLVKLLTSHMMSFMCDDVAYMYSNTRSLRFKTICFT